MRLPVVSITVLACALAAACAPVAAPRFPDDVAAAIAGHDMRRLETDTLIVYYPAGRRALAERIAGRAGACATAVRARAQAASATRAEPTRPVLVVPELPLNNAFVIPRLTGAEEIAVVATSSTLDFATGFGLPPDPGYVACHELVHAIHEQQITGAWATMNQLFGPQLSPQVGLDAWFWEGLAVHYETALQPGAGRLAWPIWRGVFAAGYAGGGALDGDDLSEWKRQASMGHHYLVGSQFVRWLVERYGEGRLWSLIMAQSSTLMFPLGVSGRFDDAYGKDLPALVEEFDRHLARTMPRRAAPATQRRLRAVGNDARYARAADGTEAVVSEDADQATRLRITASDGRVVVDRSLLKPIPPGQLVMAAPLLVSGMSFTRDGWLYFTLIDQGTTFQTTRLVRVAPDGTRGAEVVASGWGPGGAVSPDGATYWAMEVDGDAWGLAAVTVHSGARRVVVPPVPGQYVLRAAPSPSGDRLVLSVWDGARFALWVIDAASGERLAEIVGGSGAAPVYDGSFVDEDRVIYLKDVDGRFQVAVRSWRDGTETVLTDAPYTAFEPRAAADGTVRFLDREGWQWEVAEVDLPAAAGRSPSRSPSPSPSPAPAPAPAPAAEVRADVAYAWTDGLFRPQLRALALVAPGEGAALYGLVLGGGDRLGLQRWAIAGYAQPSPDPARYSVAAAYHNAMLAPWSLALVASDLRWNQGIDEDPDQPGFERHEARRQLDAVASFGRVVRGTTYVALEANATMDDFADQPRRELAGVGARLGYGVSEASPRAGTTYGITLEAGAMHYPAPTSSLGGLTALDVREAFTGRLPGTRTATLSVIITGQGLYGADENLLEVGGAAPFAPLFEATHQADPLLLPPRPRSPPRRRAAARSRTVPPAAARLRGSIARRITRGRVRGPAARAADHRRRLDQPRVGVAAGADPRGPARGVRRRGRAARRGADIHQHAHRRRRLGHAGARAVARAGAAALAGRAPVQRRSRAGAVRRARRRPVTRAQRPASAPTPPPPPPDAEHPPATPSCGSPSPEPPPSASPPPFGSPTPPPPPSSLPHEAPIAKPSAGDCAIRACVIGPHSPSSSIRSPGWLRFHSRWNACTSLPRMSAESR